MAGPVSGFTTGAAGGGGGGGGGGTAAWSGGAVAPAVASAQQQQAALPTSTGDPIMDFINNLRNQGYAVSYENGRISGFDPASGESVQFDTSSGVPVPVGQGGFSGSGLPVGFVLGKDGLTYKQVNGRLEPATREEVLAAAQQEKALGGGGGGGGPISQSVQIDPNTGELVLINPVSGAVTRTGQILGQPEVSPTAKFNEDQRVANNTLALQQRNQSLTERQQAIDQLQNAQTNMLEKAKLLESAKTSRADLKERARESDIANATAQWQTAMSLIPQLGQLSLQESQRVQEILRNGEDFVARAYETRGEKSPLARVTQADQINAVHQAMSNLRSFMTNIPPVFIPEIDAPSMPDFGSTPGAGSIPDVPAANLTPGTPYTPPAPPAPATTAAQAAGAGAAAGGEAAGVPAATGAAVAPPPTYQWGPEPMDTPRPSLQEGSTAPSAPAGGWGSEPLDTARPTPVNPGPSLSNVSVPGTLLHPAENRTISTDWNGVQTDVTPNIAADVKNALAPTIDSIRLRNIWRGLKAIETPADKRAALAASRRPAPVATAGWAAGGMTNDRMFLGNEKGAELFVNPTGAPLGIVDAKTTKKLGIKAMPGHDGGTFGNLARGALNAAKGAAGEMANAGDFFGNGVQRLTLGHKTAPQQWAEMALGRLPGVARSVLDAGLAPVSVITGGGMAGAMRAPAQGLRDVSMATWDSPDVGIRAIGGLRGYAEGTGPLEAFNAGVAGNGGSSYGFNALQAINDFNAAQASPSGGSASGQTGSAQVAPNGPGSGTGTGLGVTANPNGTFSAGGSVFGSLADAQKHLAFTGSGGSDPKGTYGPDYGAALRTAFPDQPQVTQEQLVADAERNLPPALRDLFQKGSAPAPLRAPEGLTIPTARQWAALTPDERAAAGNYSSVKYNFGGPSIEDLQRRLFGMPAGAARRAVISSAGGL